jgi:hypothetical protein
MKSGQDPEVCMYGRVMGPSWKTQVMEVLVRAGGFALVAQPFPTFIG